MKHTARVALAFASLCFFTSAACGQATSAVAQQQPAPSARHQISCRTALGPNFGMAASGPTAPYSAVQESSTVQTLADGTHISRKPTSEKIYRDSQGRIRTERPFCQGIADAPDAAVIEIHDPVSGYVYILDEQNHVAHRYALEVRQPTIRPATTAETIAPQPTLKAVVPRQNTVGPNMTTESLGAQTMEGVLVEGTKTIVIIPEGSQDNDRPITAVSERWISPELNIPIFSKHNDPRYGETTTRLAKIDVSNPILSLFQPPPDYKIVDETEPTILKYTRNGTLAPQ
jgi:hypothetical protein